MVQRLLLTATLVLVLGACGSSEDDPAPDAESVADVDAGDVVDDSDAAAAGDLAYMDMCDPGNDLCGTDLVCFQFNSRGPHCTHDCVTDDDCPAPSRGCNNMGVCKAP